MSVKQMTGFNKCVIKMGTTLQTIMSNFLLKNGSLNKSYLHQYTLLCHKKVACLTSHTTAQSCSFRNPQKQLYQARGDAIFSMATQLEICCHSNEPRFSGNFSFLYISFTTSTDRLHPSYIIKSCNYMLYVGLVTFKVKGHCHSENWG